MTARDNAPMGGKRGMVKRPYKVTRDSLGWIVKGPTGYVYSDDWRWNSRATARQVAIEYNAAAAQVQS